MALKLKQPSPFRRVDSGLLGRRRRHQGDDRPQRHAQQQDNRAPNLDRGELMGPDVHRSEFTSDPGMGEEQGLDV